MSDEKPNPLSGMVFDMQARMMILAENGDVIEKFFEDLRLGMMQQVTDGARIENLIRNFDEQPPSLEDILSITQHISNMLKLQERVMAVANVIRSLDETSDSNK